MSAAEGRKKRWRGISRWQRRLAVAITCVGGATWFWLLSSQPVPDPKTAFLGVWLVALVGALSNGGASEDLRHRFGTDRTDASEATGLSDRLVQDVRR